MIGCLKMILQLHPKRRCHLLIDIDTQKDFLLPTGRVCVRNQAEVLANIRQVMSWARREKVLIISTAEVYPNNNGFSEIDYCLDGTDGQKKVPCTLLKNRISYPADNKTRTSRGLSKLRVSIRTWSNRHDSPQGRYESLTFQAYRLFARKKLKRLYLVDFNADILYKS